MILSLHDVDLVLLSNSTVVLFEPFTQVRLDVMAADSKILEDALVPYKAFLLFRSVSSKLLYFMRL